MVYLKSCKAAMVWNLYLYKIDAGHNALHIYKLKDIFMKNTFLLLFGFLAFQFSAAQTTPEATTPPPTNQQETLKKIHSSVQTNRVPANPNESNQAKVNTSAQATQNTGTVVTPTTLPYGSVIDASGNPQQITPSTTTSPTTTGSNRSAGNMSSENVNPSGPPTPVTRDSSPRP